jgi:hypothetical protein
VEIPTGKHSAGIALHFVDHFEFRYHLLSFANFKNSESFCGVPSPSPVSARAQGLKSLAGWAAVPKVEAIE